MSFDDARKALLEASEDLEALRPVALTAIGSVRMPFSQKAWALALQRFEAAAKAYAEAVEAL